jgi:tetraacyldisaccharide 4'-kinase
MRAPDFWTRDGLVPKLLAPLSAVWGRGAAWRLAAAAPYRPPVPVICVGNLVVGGAGKTPVVEALIRRLTARGVAAHVLSRGYGGSEKGPCRVDPAHHDSRRVGDEPLLLAGLAPTWVARNRAAGAAAAVAAGAGALVMDDGFQNGTLAKTLSLLVVDGGYGFGNGRVMPAGPCREPVARGLARADAAVLVGEDRVGIAARLAQAGLPVLGARLVPGPEAAALKGRRVVAFAGIGRPAKLFTMLGELGADVVKAVAFPDHHPYRIDEFEDLAEAAEEQGAILVTTAKDAVRLPAGLRRRFTILSIALEWRDEAALDALLAKAGLGR